MADDGGNQLVMDWLILYQYGVKPFWALAVIATFLFACITLVHLGLLFLKRRWFVIPLVIGALCKSHPCKKTFKKSR
jgi:hypothetical protein